MPVARFASRVFYCPAIGTKAVVRAGERPNKNRINGFRIADQRITVQLRCPMATTLVDASQIVYLTELTGMRVIGPTGLRIGKVRDVAIAPREHPRRAARFLFGEGKTLFSVRYNQVATISLDGITLADDRFIPYYQDDYLLLLSKDLLDQQIVDVNGRKVVRVNDVMLRIEHGPVRDELWVQEVGVGL
jgi:sporulation protein YlmC with PRC-barrel domain